MERDEELDLLRAILEVRNEADSLVEECLRDRLTLEAALERILPAFASAVGASGVFLHTFDEGLFVLRTFTFPVELSVADFEKTLHRTSEKNRESFADRVGDDLLVAQPLDVAGEWFGSAGLLLPAADADPQRLQPLLQGFCEEVDNFLSAIRTAREKHFVLMAIARALRAPVFFEGIAQGVAIVRRSMNVERLLVVYTTDESASAVTGARHVEVQFYADGKLEFCTLSGKVHPDHATLIEEAAHYLHGDDLRIGRRLGFADDAHEEVLETGGAATRIVGKVLAHSRRGAFNTYDRELIAGFAGAILDRIVDFHKEWRTLARSFRPADVSRLLQTPGYQRFLDPHEQTVAMLFADISSFTRLSEQTLVTPARIFGLVDHWGREAVNCVWAERGVFDKMVGDCVVALFGPPFYDEPAEARLAAAIRAALAIRKMTRELPSKPGFAHLREVGLGVTIGVNLAPAMVGRFGPNENFTAFSSGMNNTARLQHCATRDEIVVLGDAIETLPRGLFRFGEERSAQVKNVAQPIRFRAVEEAAEGAR